MPTAEDPSDSIMSEVLDAMMIDLEFDETFDVSVLDRVRDVVSADGLTNVAMVKRAIYGEVTVEDEDS